MKENPKEDLRLFREAVYPASYQDKRISFPIQILSFRIDRVLTLVPDLFLIGDDMPERMAFSLSMCLNSYILIFFSISSKS